MSESDAKDAITELIDRLDIRQVICVDDSFAVGKDDVLAAQVHLNENQLASAFDLEPSHFEVDSSVRRRRVERAWEALDPHDQRRVGPSIMAEAAKLDEDIRVDFGAITTLGELISSNLLQTLSLSDWRAKWPTLKTDFKEGNVLFLFDQDMSKEGGSETEGIGMVKAVLAEEAFKGRATCGLLTHTATETTQYQRWTTLAQEQDLSPDEFIVIAKRWLTEQPLGFARMLKLSALGPDCSLLKTRVRALLDEAIDEAQKAIEDMHIYDFEHVVFRAASEEGMWEPDMLLRLFGIMQRTELRKLMKGDDEVNAVTSRIRAVSSITTKAASDPHPESWRLQRLDSYEDGDYINAYHLPIDVGDIFKKGDGTSKYYILVCQSCDLAVRKQGIRKPDLTDVALLEVSERQQDDSSSSVKLPYFDEDPTKTWYAHLNRAFVVHPLMLDLCAFNKDGRSRIRLNDPLPENLVPSWSARYNKLSDEIRRAITNYSSFLPEVVGGVEVSRAVINHVANKLPKVFPPFVPNNKLFKPSLNTQSGQEELSFNCTRIRRLHRPSATALARRFADHLSRPALDTDLGRQFD